MKKGGPFYTFSGNAKGTPTMETSMEAPQEIKIEPLSDSAIPLLGIYPKEIKPQLRDFCIPMLPEASVFMITKVWKQCKCSSADEWIKKIIYIHICVKIYIHTSIYEKYVNII